MPRLFPFATLALLLASCGGGDGPAAAPPESVSEAANAPFQAIAQDDAIVAAGRDVQLALAGAPEATTYRVHQLAGVPLGAITVSAGKLNFHAPPLATAGSAELQLEATDAQGRVTTTALDITVAPASDSGRLLTLIGSPGSAGLHWIITGDGFTEAQQDDLRRAALRMGRALTGAPELAAHAAVWNVHVLGAVSRDSGVDDSRAGIAASTAFDGALACTGVARVGCVDWFKVQKAVTAERAPRAYLAVVLNTAEYIGTSGPNGLIISRHESAPLLGLHEMGHQVAGLADEYVDAVTAMDLLPLYVEGRYPNVTTFTDASLLPWRHWLGSDGVGLHEGAYYAATGFYRPKHDSLMRTLSAPLGEVSAEAWLRAQYRRVPLVTDSLPRDEAVRGLGGDTLEFEVVSAWRGVLDTRWYVDGNEVAAARGALELRLTADGGTHHVRVDATDTSGRIRAPSATEARFSRRWTVSPDAPTAASKAGGDFTAKQAPDAPVPSEWLQLRVDGAGHSVLGRVPASALATPGSGGDPAGGDWEYSVLDDAGAVVASGAIADPRVVRGPLALPGEDAPSHAMAVLPVGDYRVGLPANANARKLRLTPATAAHKNRIWSGSLPGSIEIELDVP